MDKNKKPEKIADRFEVIETIGSGGMGTVYKAIDPLLNKEVAVKLLQHDYDGTEAARLQQEATAAGKLNHPHICRILNFGQSKEGSPYMVMEYLQGQDLADFIQKNGPLSLEAALEVAIQVCGAMSYAHQHGIVHRDLKPANVLLLKSRNEGIFTKLLDFGVARLEERKGDLTEAGSIIGSPLYISPEQITGDSIGPASDIYSFGCMFFEMLTGEPPFRGASVVETFAMHKSAEIPSISLQGECGTELESLITQCLSKSPAMRPASAKEIMNRLEKIQTQVLTAPVETDTQDDDSAQKERERVRKRNIKISIGLVSVLVIGGLFSIVGDVLSRKKLPETKMDDKIPVVDAAGPFFGEEAKSETLFLETGKNTIYGVNLKAVPTVTDKDLKVLSDKKIYRLGLDTTPIDGSGLQYITNCGIVELLLDDTRVTDENMKYFRQMKNLRVLHIASNALTDEGFKQIADIPFFSLQFGSKNLTANGLASMKNLGKANDLRFKGEYLPPEFVKFIQPGNNLETIGFHSSVVKGDLGELLARFTRLKQVDITSPISIEPEALRSLSKLHLFVLQITGTDLDEKQMEAITSLDKLETFTFYQGQIGVDSLKNLHRMKELSSLSLSGVSNMSGKGIIYVSRVKKLAVLSIRNTNINPEDLKNLLSLSELAILDLMNCPNLDIDSLERFRDQYTRRWGHKIQLNY